MSDFAFIGCVVLASFGGAAMGLGFVGGVARGAVWWIERKRLAV